MKIINVTLTRSPLIDCTDSSFGALLDGEERTCHQDGLIKERIYYLNRHSYSSTKENLFLRVVTSYSLVSNKFLIL